MPEIESEADLSGMTVSDLKSFLTRLDVPLASVMRLGGKPGAPRKADFLSRAIDARNDYLDAMSPSSPKRAPNPFQAPNTPPLAASSPVRRSGRGGGSGDADAAAAPTATKKKHRRRSSVGWLDPNLMLPAPLAPVPPAPPHVAATHRAAEASAAGERQAASFFEEYAGDGAGRGGYVSAGGDEVVASGASASESEGGASSVFATDDDDSDAGARVDVFEEMRVAELKEWLARNKIEFLPRAKKATLISRARAHQVHLESLEAVVEVVDDASEDKDEVVAVEIEEEKVIELATPPAAGERRRQEKQKPQQKPKTAAPFSIDEGIVEDAPIDLDRDEDVVQPAPRRRRESEWRLAEKATKEKSTRIEKPSRRAAAAEGRKSRAKSAAAQRAAAPAKEAVARIQWPKFTMPRVEPKLAARYFMLAVGVLIWLCLVRWLYEGYQYSKRPFCDAGRSAVAGGDGGECRPCPDHGRCVEGELECASGFKRVDARCALDQEVSLYADELANQASKILKDRAGRAECGESVERQLSAREIRSMLEPSEDVSSDSVGIGAKKSTRRRASKYDARKFDPAFALALGLLDKPEPFGVGVEYGKYVALVPGLPYSCILRRFLLRQWRVFGTLFGLVGIYVYLSLKWKQSARRKRAIMEARDAALDALEEQHRQSVFNDLATPVEDYVTDTHLRDEVLGSNDVAALNLWKEVEKELKRDTRVSLSGREEHKGRPCYKWRWIGRQSLGGPSSRRTSFGSAAEFTPGRTPGTGGKSWGRSSFGSVGRSSFGSAGSAGDGDEYFGGSSGRRASSGSGAGSGSAYLSGRPSRF